jgi:hypothetical protein
MEERMMDDNDIGIIQADEMEDSVDMPLKIDSLYDMVTCDECGIGLPFEWILSHLKENHGIKTQMADVMRYLDMFSPSMRLQEAKEWIKSTWVANHYFFHVTHCVKKICVGAAWSSLQCHTHLKPKSTLT